MRMLFRSAALAAALSATLPAVLVAQGGGSGTPSNPACPLVTEKEVDAATGLDYRPGEAVDVLGEGIFGGATCLWGGASMIPGKDLPQIGIVFIPPGSRGSYTEWSRSQKPQPGCTREPLRGIGDVAFAEACEQRPSMSVYVKTGKNDVLVMINQLEDRPVTWARPVALALAKAAAPKAKGQ